ncbi:MAG: hypothetical protein UX81_C0003G0029 [Parcubacteria group bacterium GW2011_GWA2_47_12]|nr:MAG: hypothetical protein UX81_C0003G0029 [Parcubacteria group bacterium GW2011_GWA2_47_12]
MRISFAGGGTDLSSFYRHYPGRVISTAIDKYSYVTINHPPLVKKVAARYVISELVNHPRELKNDRIRAALLSFGIENNIDIGNFSDAPVKTGLGSSSSFTAALIKGLSTHIGKRIDKQELAEAASRLEIESLREPIGKQDQYAATFGGFNIFQFNPDETVDVLPVRMDFKKRLDFESRLFLFFTGITRLASSVLAEQQSKTAENLETLKKMSDSVFDFRDKLLLGDFRALGEMLHEGWLMKKTLASNVSNKLIDDFYNAGMQNGAWGGKILGAGGGGCVLFVVPSEKRNAVREAMLLMAKQNSLLDSGEIPVRFVQSGAEILMNHG